MSEDESEREKQAKRHCLTHIA